MRWLRRLQDYRPAQGGDFWNALEIHLLRREAEGLILDAAFPSDPFAP